MPELPEVEHARKQWEKLGMGRIVVGVSAPDPTTIRRVLSSRPSDADPDGVLHLANRIGARVMVPIRRGKRLGLPLSDGWVVLCHLGMTGRWIRRSEGQHGRVGLHLDDGWTWWFEDPRRFGALVLRLAEEAAWEGLGPDALDHPWTGEELAAAYADCRTAVKPALLDQTRVAGIGNIQAVEALWYAQIAPQTSVVDLDLPAWNRLAEGIRWTLTRTIASAGDGELVYLSQDKGQPNPFVVYGRGGEPCGRCGSLLATSSIAGRTTTWCPDCQPRRDKPAGLG